MGQLLGVEISSESPQEFNGQATLWSAGALSIAEMISSDPRPTWYVRTTPHVHNGDDDFSLTLCRQNVVVRTAQSEGFEVQRRGAFFLRHDGRFSVATPEQHTTSYLMRIDRKTLIDLLPRSFDPEITNFAANSPMLQLIWNYLPLLTSEAANGPPQSRDMLGRHVVDLVALMLKPSRDGMELIRGRGLKAVRTKALLDAIDRHFATPDLSPAMIAHQLGISARQVHRLLEETPKTFEEHVLEHRLQHAYRLLTAPGRGPASVADIAAASGFSGVSQFNRAFRSRFGDTPTGIRGATAREKTLRVLRQSMKSAP